MTRLLDPLDAIGAHELLMPVHETVEFHVALAPLQVGVREVHARRELRPARSGVDARRAGVGEEVEEALARGKLADELARITMVEEEPRVEIAREVDFEQQAVLLRDEMPERAG